MREQRKESNFLISLSQKRLLEQGYAEDQDKSLSREERELRARARERAAEAIKRKHSEDLKELEATNMGKMGSHWSEKPLVEMTERDWRIFREDFDIRIQGGRATLPLRFWKEAEFPEELMSAISDMGYENPSPIQRQAIPIGLALRDIIGIAETGSGKTLSYILPMIRHIRD